MFSWRELLTESEIMYIISCFTHMYHWFPIHEIHLKWSSNLFNRHPHIAPILTSSLCVCRGAHLAEVMNDPDHENHVDHNDDYDHNGGDDQDVHYNQDDGNLAKCSGPDRTEVEITLGHFPCCAHLFG